MSKENTLKSTDVLSNVVDICNALPDDADFGQLAGACLGFLTDPAVRKKADFSAVQQVPGCLKDDAMQALDEEEALDEKTVASLKEFASLIEGTAELVTCLQEDAPVVMKKKSGDSFIGLSSDLLQ